MPVLLATMKIANVLFPDHTQFYKKRVWYWSGNFNFLGIFIGRDYLLFLMTTVVYCNNTLLESITIRIVRLPSIKFWHSKTYFCCQCLKVTDHRMQSWFIVDDCKDAPKQRRSKAAVIVKPM